ncbi:MAG: Ion transport 2 domain protein [Phycisphaerales bacterium]|nr:Ion transport 2 domain protein [Phycisphaerales bacterium]
MISDTARLGNRAADGRATIAFMRPILGILGFLMLGYALVELLRTTFLEGGAPLITRICQGLAKVFLSIHHRRRGSRKVIAAMGLFAVISTVLVWTMLIWVAWTLIYCAGERALISTETLEPANAVARAYFAGYTIFTLGLGDYRPEGGFWQILTSIAAGSGFLLFGLTIAYTVSVVSAATQKRQLALCIWSLGKSPDDIILRAWNGMDTTALGPHLVSLTAMLALLGESHLTYPVLHYFHSTKRSSSVAARVAALDEALTVLECGLQKGCSLDLPSLGAARESITEFLQTLKPALIAPAAEVPPSPSLQALRESGVPVVEDELFEAAVAALAGRRKLLLALVLNEGWTWDEVWPVKLLGLTPFRPNPVPDQSAPSGETNT